MIRRGSATATTGPPSAKQFAPQCLARGAVGVKKRARLGWRRADRDRPPGRPHRARRGRHRPRPRIETQARSLALTARPTLATPSSALKHTNGGRGTHTLSGCRRRTPSPASSRSPATSGCSPVRSRITPARRRVAPCSTGSQSYGQPSRSSLPPAPHPGSERQNTTRQQRGVELAVNMQIPSQSTQWRPL